MRPTDLGINPEDDMFGGMALMAQGAEQVQRDGNLKVAQVDVLGNASGAPDVGEGFVGASLCRVTNTAAGKGALDGISPVARFNGDNTKATVVARSCEGVGRGTCR